MKKWMLIAALFVATRAHAITVDDYIASLERTHALLASNQFAVAKTEALAIESEDVTWAGGTFHADETLLHDIENATHANPQLLRRIEVTIDEVRRAAPNPGSAANQKILDEVARAQKAPELEKGGEVPTKMRADAPLLERIAKAIEDAAKWIGDKLEKLLKWLLDFLPRRRMNMSPATFAMRWIVISVVTMIVLILIILAVEVVRRGRRGKDKPIEASAPIGSTRDEDPLSRPANEWERYAAQLASAGRYREAIRAWYHAVLVTCYGANILYFRKGRTNWEYVAALSPNLDWRAEFIALTRRFELEWYGSMRSTEEALDDCASRAKTILDAVRA